MNDALHLADSLFDVSREARAASDDLIKALSEQGGQSVKNVGKLRKLCAPLQSKRGGKPHKWGVPNKGDRPFVAVAANIVDDVRQKVESLVDTSAQEWREQGAQQRKKMEEFIKRGHEEWEMASNERAEMRERWLALKAQVDKEEDAAAARFDMQAQSVVSKVASVVTFARTVGRQEERKKKEQQQTEVEISELGNAKGSGRSVGGSAFSSLFTGSPFAKGGGGANDVDDLSSAAEYLAALKLEHYAEQLSDSLGADTVADLRQATERDLLEAGMKKLHARRLLKALQA